MTALGEWDAGDSFDAMAEMIRRQVVDAAVNADHITIYREMSPTEQMACFMAGAMTAVVGVCLAVVKEGDRDKVMTAIEEYLPLARQQAEYMLTLTRPEKPE